jgi:hypothetical protein
VNADFEEFFELLNSKSVEFLVIGGVAYNFHAPPRATKDIDIWVNPNRAQLTRLVGCIGEFGFPTEGIEVEDLASNARVLMLGRVPNRIDVLTRPAGVAWSDCWSNRVAGRYGKVAVAYISREDLVVAKFAAGRPQDLVDVAKLLESEPGD